MAAAALAACLAASCALGGIAAGSGGAGEPGLAAAAAASASYHFLALGDYGASFETGRVKKGTPPPEDTCSTSAAACTAHGDKSCGADPEQAALGQQMGAYAEAHGVGHVVLLGDNFYSSGIHSHDVSCRFARTFEDIYNGSALDVPFYAIAGNHDHYGNVSAQIAYTALQTRWVYPDWYYGVEKSFSDGAANVTMEFLLFDTVIADSADGLYGAAMTDELPAGHLGALPAGAPSAQEQWEWLEQRLADSTADYLWVAGHHPVWSGCSHGPDANLVAKLKPLLEKYNASGYLYGHDHCNMHVDEGLGPVYVLSGAGFECCYPAKNAAKVPAGSIKMAYWLGDCPPGAVCPNKAASEADGKGAFVAFEVTAQSTTIRHIDSDGMVIFTAEPVLARTSAQKPGAARARACTAKLERVCGGARNVNAGNCLVCASMHQGVLKGAGCGQHGVASFCAVG